VIIVAVALVLLAFAPYGLLAVSGISNADWQFMGILHNSRDGAAYLGKITQDQFTCGGCVLP
jgi:hypothetical protein